ncbi:MAG: helix-turn-helix domain-containing protein [Bacteroidetes bacterium]|nr:helix-turn-helix domain-containing protein [Bacteroidota bacterium]
MTNCYKSSWSCFGENTSAIEHKLEFINEWLSNRHTVTELCEAFEISRTTAHKYIRRFYAEGHSVLFEKSWVPGKHLNQTHLAVELRVNQSNKQYLEKKKYAIMKHTSNHSTSP